MNQETRPNFFLVGAPKCGTTAMAYYLAQHAEVFIPNLKEPNYFLHPTADNRTIAQKKHYLSLFRKGATKTRVGDASVWYLYSNHARKSIYEFDPEAKIIIMTRDKVEFVASLHSQMLFSQVEKEQDLSKAWSIAKERTLDGTEHTIESIPDWRLMYAELLQHEKYIGRYKRAFGAKNVMVLPYEKLASDSSKAYREVLSFLELADDGRQYFERINSNKAHKREIIRKFIYYGRRQRWWVALTGMLKRRMGIGSLGLYRLMTWLNSKSVRRPSVPSDLRCEIEATAHQLEPRR